MLRRLWRLGCLSALLVAGCLAQETGQSPPPAEKVPETQKLQNALVQLKNLPAEWLIGPYIPVSGPLIPLTKEQRFDVYFHQNYLSAGPYVLHLFTAGIDQARDYPSQWGGGMAAYGQRFGNRFGRSGIADAFAATGNAALGYEPRYDLCRCHKFWARTGHAVMRNFFTYNHTETELRFAVPSYAGAFGAGMLSATWLPGKQSVWRDGAYGALAQAGWGSAYNWVSEFAVDILRKITKKPYLNNQLSGRP